MIYVVALPFQIPPIGVESIGPEIENPFGYDGNDLPMDQFCEDFRREQHALMSRTKTIACEEWGEAYALTPVPEVYKAQKEDGCASAATENVGGSVIPHKLDVVVKHSIMNFKTIIAAVALVFIASATSTSAIPAPVCGPDGCCKPGKYDLC
ncbi:hypothetical protein BJ742DRAFT_775934 [Cladochytrium replicatum]|nr:hypothetical protein BJ742DRAFT_775934 [Cladochytrium replicatum]